MKSSVFILFLLIGILGFAQNQNIILKGKVVVQVEFNQVDYEYIHVKNITQSNQTQCDSIGNFLLKANLGDSIQIFSSSIENRKLKISQRVYEKEAITIYTKEATVELDEAVITPFETTGYLDLDVKKNQAKIDSAMVVADSLSKWVKKWGGNPDAIRLEDFDANTYWDQFPLSNNLDNIRTSYVLRDRYGNVVRELVKDAIAAEKHKKQQVVIQATIDYFGEDLFVEEYGISKDKIFQFVEYCYLTNTTFKQKFLNLKFLEILEIFDQKKESFFKRINSEE